MSYSTISNTLVVEISFYSIMKDILVRKSKFNGGGNAHIFLRCHGNLV